MNTIEAKTFQEQCMALLDGLAADGLIITKDGKPIARVLPYDQYGADLIGAFGTRSRFWATSLQPASAGMQTPNNRSSGLIALTLALTHPPGVVVKASESASPRGSQSRSPPHTLGVRMTHSVIAGLPRFRR